jgi:hypothetical protein
MILSPDRILGKSLFLFWPSLILFTLGFSKVWIVMFLFVGLLLTVSMWDEINDRDVITSTRENNTHPDYTPHLRVLKCMTFLYVCFLAIVIVR